MGNEWVHAHWSDVAFQVVLLLNAAMLAYGRWQAYHLNKKVDDVKATTEQHIATCTDNHNGPTSV